MFILPIHTAFMPAEVSVLAAGCQGPPHCLLQDFSGDRLKPHGKSAGEYSGADVEMDSLASQSPTDDQ